MTDVPAFGIYEELHHLRLEEVLRWHPVAGRGGLNG